MAATQEKFIPTIYKPREPPAKTQKPRRTFSRSEPWEDELTKPLTIIPTSGYSGHISGFRENAIARTFHKVVEDIHLNSHLERHRKDAHEKNIKAQREAEKQKVVGRSSGQASENVAQSSLGSMFTNFRCYQAGEDRRDRYASAIAMSTKLGTTQDMLLKLVLGKIYKKANTTAELTIRIRKMFEYFDLDGSQELDEEEFRQCLELMNIQLDDCQSLALFALFDTNFEGIVTFKDFIGVFQRNFSVTGMI